MFTLTRDKKCAEGFTTLGQFTQQSLRGWITLVWNAFCEFCPSLNTGANSRHCGRIGDWYQRGMAFWWIHTDACVVCFRHMCFLCAILQPRQCRACQFLFKSAVWGRPFGQRHVASVDLWTVCPRRFLLCTEQRDNTRHNNVNVFCVTLASVEGP